MAITFPLRLPCGHRPLENCRCARPVQSSRFANGAGSVDSAITRAQDLHLNQWRQTLENYGCHLPSGRRHGPCPICGGKDRFRFDDKAGRGTWFCSHCDPHAGDGLSLLAAFIGKSVLETAKELADHLSVRTAATARRHVVTWEEENKIREYNHKQAAKAAAVMLNSAIYGQHAYMTRKGLSGDWLVNGEMLIDYTGRRFVAGDLLFVPVYKDGNLINVQRIDQEGRKLFIFGGEIKEGYHILDPIPGDNGRTIGIAEGYATAVTARLLTNAKIYVAFSANNLAAVAQRAMMDNPGAVLVVFADNDQTDENTGFAPGLHYAKAAAAPFNGLVMLPPELGDWDDMRIKYGIDKAREMLRSAYKNRG